MASSLASVAPPSCHGPPRSPTRLPRAYVTALASPHVVELLMPLYPTIPRPCATANVAIHTVALAATGAEALQLEFPELSVPGKMVSFDVACVGAAVINATESVPHVCRLTDLLRQLLRLCDERMLRITAKYVILRVADASGPWAATLQLFVALHERATQSDVASRLSALAFALSHLQAGLMAARSRPDGSRSVEAMAVARRSRCHVIGCDLHIDAKPTQYAKRLQLHDVFLQLMAHDRRDDERSHITDPKRAKLPTHVYDLPQTALHSCIRMLTAKDVAAFSGVCSLFRHASYEVVPGLKLQLFRHQQTALQWLLHREGSSRQLEHVPHPFFFPSLQHGEDTDASRIDLIDGRLVTFPRTPRAADTRGGLFCDEPGLGKTITMLALLLRTKGQRSNPRDLQDERPSTRTTRISPRFAAHGREVDTRDLLPSSATLLIVPRPLLDHWRFQIATHVTRRMLRVFLDDDDSNSDLPPAATLTQYDVVITSFDRLSDHWKFHKPTSASEQNRPNRYGYEDTRERFIDGFENRGTSPLLRVHWVRIVVDEGHMLGGRRTTNHMCMAELLHASKRWVMTGTPLPNHFQSEDLRHLHGLLAFLRERPYGEVDTKAWTKAIAKPFERNSHEGFVRLLRLLRRIMLRHTKQSILKQIPSPVCHVVLVDATPREFAAYNGIIAGIRLNLVTNQPDPDDTTGTSRLHFNSLLHTTNRGYAGVAIRNLRDATCGGGRVRVSLLEKDFDETLAMLHTRSVPADRIQEVAAFLRGVVGWDLQCVCPVCSLKFPVLLLIPCGHFVCADCTESHGRQCGVCHVRFDWKAFQAIQPGFEITFKEDEWHYGGVELFAKPAPRVKKTPLPPGVKEPKPKPKKRVFIPIDHSKFSLVSTSKTYYVARRIAELADAFDADEAQPRAARVGVVRPKVIVFSQVRNRIYQLKIALAQHAITSEEFVGGMSAAARTAALVAFRNKPRSTVLLLSDAGSHGLDLSFVTHIFLMEEVLDASLEAQVIARAHRMGAKQQVVVEKLLMRGSLEESLHASRQQRRRDRGEEKEAEGRDEHETEGFRHKLLRSLRAIDESAVAAFGFLRFQVLDENGNLVRADTVRLPNPGDPLPTGQPLSFSKPRRKEAAAPLEAEAVEALVELERRPWAITGEPLSVSEETPTPPRNKTMQVMRPARKAIARIKREPSADDRMSRPPPAASVAVIDLTSDTSDSDVAEENTAMEIDDSETDDEWAEVLKEEKTLAT